MGSTIFNIGVIENMFIVNFTGLTPTTDKTYSEIREAAIDGKVVVGLWESTSGTGSQVMSLSDTTNSKLTFTGCTSKSNVASIYSIIIDGSDNVTISVQRLQLMIEASSTDIGEGSELEYGKLYGVYE